MKELFQDLIVGIAFKNSGLGTPILVAKEEKNLSRFLGKQQIELIDEFGKPDGVIHNDDGKILIFTTQKYKITCERKFTIDNKGIISGFNSRNCF